MGTPHTTTRTGNKVSIKLRNGTLIHDRYKETSARFVFLMSGRRIHKHDIRSFMPGLPRICKGENACQ